METGFLLHGLSRDLADSGFHQHVPRWGWDRTLANRGSWPSRQGTAHCASFQLHCAIWPVGPGPGQRHLPPGIQVSLSRTFIAQRPQEGRVERSPGGTGASSGPRTPHVVGASSWPPSGTALVRGASGHPLLLPKASVLVHLAMAIGVRQEQTPTPDVNVGEHLWDLLQKDSFK